MMKRLLSALFAVVLALALPLSTASAAPTAWAASGDLDEILNYTITVDVNDDATLDMVYHIDWKVLDSTSEGPLTWVLIGIPNKHYVSIDALSKTIRNISYDSSDGSCVRIDLDRAYRAGEVASFDFVIVQDYMYQVGRDNQGEAVFEFTPGWFDSIEVDNLVVKWNANAVERIAPAAQQNGKYYTWKTSLDKGDSITVTVGYPDDAFAFDIDKTIQNGNNGNEYYYGSDDFESIVGGLIVLLIFALFMGGIIKFMISMMRGIASLFDRDANFATKKRITRTKVVYYPVCQGCGAARPEGKETCDYCGRSFIQSQETVTEEDIPVEENEIKHKNKAGEYAYKTEPNTFLRVNVVTVPFITTGGGGSRTHGGGGGYSGGSSSCACACASSCACACGCACACACAGGGRAGCTTKDFYNTDLKLSQLEKHFKDA